MALLEELVEEVLLRLPPAEPASLVRAALVCKPWCRVISGRRFRRRFREFHRSPPMLGFICSMFDDNEDEDCISRFLPTSTFRPLHADHGGRVLDARHGRVLLLTYTEDETGFVLVVWDPTTDKRWKLPTAPVGPSNHDVFRWNATVLCAATASGACNHLDCQGGPFMVVSVGATTKQVSALCVYSSQVGAWSERNLLPKCYVEEKPTALVGNTLYFSAEFGDMALAYDLATRETSVIRLPLPPEHYEYEYATALMTMKDGVLGIARLNKAGRLYLWSMEANANRDGRMVWTQTRVIELKKLLPINARSIYVRFLGFAHYVGVFFMGTSDGLFTYDLKSGRVRKVCDELCADDGIYGVVPYMSFYTPALRALSTDDGSRGASRACPRGSSE